MGYFFKPYVLLCILMLNTYNAKCLEILENECLITCSPANRVRPVRKLSQEIFEISGFHSIAVNNVSSNSQINNLMFFWDVIFGDL